MFISVNKLSDPSVLISRLKAYGFEVVGLDVSDPQIDVEIECRDGVRVVCRRTPAPSREALTSLSLVELACESTWTPEKPDELATVSALRIAGGEGGCFYPDAPRRDESFYRRVDDGIVRRMMKKKE